MIHLALVKLQQLIREQEVEEMKADQVKAELTAEIQELKIQLEILKNDVTKLQLTTVAKPKYNRVLSLTEEEVQIIKRVAAKC